MRLFKNQTHQDIWIEHNCGTCFHYPGGCKILDKALREDRKPPQWDRNTRTKNTLMQDSIKCKERNKRTPKPVADEDVPMFDVTPINTSHEVDHA